MEAAFDRPGLLAQAVRDLADGELFEVAQQHHLEVVGGQRFERACKVDAQRGVGSVEHLLLGQILGQRLVPKHQPLEPPALALDHDEKPG